MPEIRLLIDSSYDDVPQVGAAVRALCREEAVADDVAAMIELAVVEAVNNSIRHAYHGRPGGWIEVRFAAGEELLEAEISDAGAPIDAERLTSIATSESGSGGGIGLAMINRIADEVRFDREGGSNRLRLTKRRAAAVEP